MHVEVPELLTPRLRLRAYQPDDYAPFLAQVTDAERSRFSGGSVDRRTAWRVFLSHAGMWVLAGCGWWTIELRETAGAIGHIGAFLRDGFPDGEVGWSVYPPHNGKGIATEAAGAAIAHAFDTHGWPRITAMIDDTNAPSIRVAERLGMHRDGVADLYGTQVRRYALTRTRP
ncbi:MAG TPA: GNAT family N-acetyltransferase [Kofleriaceae bacterium]|jgi:RimJ/RimL family protein N-acetyltransferase